MQVVLIAGLPGSGKSRLAAEYGGRGFVVVDDIRDRESLALPLARNADVVVTDPNFCKPAARAAAESWIRTTNPLANVVWIFFSNDPDQCRLNVARRKAQGDAREVEGTIARMASLYAIPADATTIPVWRD